MLTVGRCLGAVNERALTGFKCAGLDVDADLCELLLQELQRFERLAVVVGRPERRMKALREARFLQKFASSLGVIREGAIVDGALNLRGQIAGGGHRQPVIGHLDECIAVDGKTDGLAYAHVVKGLLRLVHGDVAGHYRRRLLNGELAVGFECLHLFGRHGPDELRFTGAKHHGAGGVFSNRNPAKTVEFRQSRDAVVGVLYHFEHFGGFKVLEHIRASAAGFIGRYFLGGCGITGGRRLLEQARADH